MKLVVWKNYFGGKILYRTADPPIKNGVNYFIRRFHGAAGDSFTGSWPVFLFVGCPRVRLRSGTLDLGIWFFSIFAFYAARFFRPTIATLPFAAIRNWILFLELVKKIWINYKKSKNLKQKIGVKCNYLGVK